MKTISIEPDTNAILAMRPRGDMNRKPSCTVAGLHELAEQLAQTHERNLRVLEAIGPFQYNEGFTAYSDIYESARDVLTVLASLRIFAAY